MNYAPKSIAERALAAQEPELPPELVRGLNGFGLWRRITEAWSKKRGRLYEGALASGAMFARKVASLDLPQHQVFFGYSYDSLETLEAEKSQGVLTIVDQVDPGIFEQELVMEESERWKSYASLDAPPPNSYFERNRQEWQAADVIIVNSEWSQQALIKSGAPRDKLEVLPLAYEAPSADFSNRNRKTTKNLRVLWLGTLCVRKGIQYLIEAARTLESYPVEFLIAGPLQIPISAIREAPRNMRFIGQVPRSQAGEFYQQGDVFVLPTISDGFALTQLEALAHGVPIIVTPNCGRVVEDGVTGLVIPARDPKGLTHAILRFVRDRNLAASMAPKCREAVRQFSIDRCGVRLAEIIGKHSDRRSRPPENLCQQTA